MTNWDSVDKEVTKAFTDGTVITVDRATLERWMVGLCFVSHPMKHEQDRTIRQLESIRHLIAVRLTEESEQRRDTQQAVASAAMRRQNFWTRVVSITALILTGIGIWVTWWTKTPAPPPVVSAYPSPNVAPSVSPATPQPGPKPTP